MMSLEEFCARIVELGGAPEGTSGELMPDADIWTLLDSVGSLELYELLLLEGIIFPEEMLTSAISVLDVYEWYSVRASNF